jgi:hypothetical protein
MCFRDWEDGYKSKHKDIFYERRIRKMSIKKWKNKELSTLLNERWGFSMDLDKLSESKEITHMCALKVTHKKSGKKGHPIKHTLSESGKISHYTVEFDDVIVENIAVEDLHIVKEEKHSHKRDDVKDHDKNKKVVSEDELEEEAKPDFPDIDGDGDRKEPISKAAKDKKAKGGDDKEEQKNEIKMGAHIPDRGQGLSKPSNKKDNEKKDDNKKRVKMKEAEMSVDELAQKIRDFATIEKLRQALKRAEEMEKEKKDDKKDS